MGTLILEEAGAGHQSGVVNIGTGYFAQKGNPRKFRELPRVSSHVALGGDAAIKVAAHQGQCLLAGCVGGDVNVRVDEPRQHIKPGNVHYFAACGRNELGRRRDSLDPFSAHQNGDVLPRDVIHAVNQRGSLIDRERVSLAQCVRMISRQQKKQRKRVNRIYPHVQLSLDTNGNR